MNTTCSECCNKEIIIKKLARGVEKKARGEKRIL